jgi:hypothetical protein
MQLWPGNPRCPDSRLHKDVLYLLRRNPLANQNLPRRIQVEQLQIAHVLQLLRRLLRRLEETLREDVPGGCFDPDFLFVVLGNDDLLYGVLPLRLMHDSDHTPFMHLVPLQ